MAEQGNGQVRLPALPDNWTYSITIGGPGASIDISPNGDGTYKAVTGFAADAGEPKTRAADYDTLREAVAGSVGAIRAFVAVQERRAALEDTAQTVLDAFGEDADDVVEVYRRAVEADIADGAYTMTVGGKTKDTEANAERIAAAIKADERRGNTADAPHTPAFGGTIGGDD